MAGSNFDMKTLVSTYAEPERTMIQALKRYHGIPGFAIAGASDAKVFDQQAAAEAALTLAVETLAGGNIIHDLGYLESGLTFSFQQLILCNEIVSWIQAFGREFEVSNETLALDVIVKAGPDGDFLTTDHTLGHFRDRWYPSLFERATHHAWLQKGGRTLAERATLAVDDILSKHTPEPLPPDVALELRHIAQAATPLHTS